ncbi:MAG: nucleoside triphosphate hydrolase [Pseudomonadota bacterium]
MTRAMTDDTEALLTRLRTLSAGPRTLVAIAGAPGSGKSTLAETLQRALGDTAAAILPMDGFHYDDGLLSHLGRKARKGAPDTFDVGGLKTLLTRLRENVEPAIAVPLFDRSIEIARAGAALIPREVPLVLVEGNYLLLNEAPWDALAPLFDLTVFVAVEEAELARRLTARWEGFGLGPDEVRRKVAENDLPNGRFVTTHSAPADVVISAP